MKKSIHYNTKFLSALNFYGVGIVFGLTFIFVCIKSISIPITHDEVATAFYYPKLTFWQIVSLSNGDQNNHILNTLFSKWSIAIFGMKLWAIRLPSVLSFLIYCFGAWKIINCLLPKHSKFYVAAALLFVLSPYLVDFFCLSRGYGMSISLISLSVAFLLEGFKNKRSKPLFYSIILATLACLASFSSISFLCAIIALVFIYIIFIENLKTRSLMLYFGLILCVSGALYLPLTRISEAGQFANWTNNGFIQDTLMSIVRLSLYGSKIFLTTNIITYFFIIVLIGGFVYSLTKFRTSIKLKKDKITSNLIVLVLAFLTVFINVLQGLILDLPNLNGRIALFFYPLIVAGLIACKPIFNWMNPKVKTGILVIVLALGIHHVLHISSLKYVLEWKYDAHTLEVLNIVENHSSSKPILLESNWIFQPSLSFHQKVDNYSSINIGNYSKKLNPLTTADFYYCKAEDYPLLAKNFTILAKFEDNWLLKHKKSLNIP